MTNEKNDGPMEFSLELQERSLTVDGKSYVLREPTEEAACAYRDALTSGAQMEGRRITKMGSVAGAEPILVSRCLFEADGVGRRSVSIKTIYGWPSRAVKKMFEWLSEVGNLREKEEGDEDEGGPKNSPIATGDSSE